MGAPRAQPPCAYTEGQGEPVHKGGICTLSQLDFSLLLETNGLPLHCTWGVVELRHFHLLRETWLRHLGLLGLHMLHVPCCLPT